MPPLKLTKWAVIFRGRGEEPCLASIGTKAACLNTNSPFGLMSRSEQPLFRGFSINIEKPKKATLEGTLHHRSF